MTAHWTDDPNHPTHAAALAQRCPLCHANPGQPCQTITNRPLNRRLHHARNEAP